MNTKKSGLNSQDTYRIEDKKRFIFQKSMLLIERTSVEEGLGRRYLLLKSWRLRCLYLKQGLGL